MRKINILWLDDDLRPKSQGPTGERQRLQLWLRWLATGDRPERYNIIEVQTLLQFRQELQRRYTIAPDHPDHIDAFLIDIFWRRERKPWMFDELDQTFADEEVKPLDAGAQLIGLMRNSCHAANRPPWMAAFHQHPIAVLTTITDNRDTLEAYLEPGVHAGIRSILKAANPEQHTEPAADFCEWVRQLRHRGIPAGVAAAPDA